MGPNGNDIKKNPFILGFLSSHKRVQLWPIAAENSHHTIWQWIFSTILLRKLLSFLGLTMSPGNLSPLSGLCLVKYCFKKHSPRLFFPICAWEGVVDAFSSLSDHSPQPCCCHVPGLPPSPRTWLCAHLTCRLARNWCQVPDYRYW